MAEKIERTYNTTFTEALPMDKYNQLLLDIARLIADTDRENFLLKCDLENVKDQLAAAETKLKAADDRIACAEKARDAMGEQLETVVAKQAIMMMQEDDANA